MFLFNNSLKIFLLFLVTSFLGFSQNIYVAKSGSDTNSGAQDSPFKTIEKASSIATSGTTIIIGEGTYHEILKPKNSGVSGNPIIYKGEEGKKVIISAMESLSNWEKDKGDIYKTKIDWDLGQENFLLNKDVAMDLARWPNNEDGIPFTLNSMRNDGGSDSNTINNAFLTSSKIPDIDWTGGVVFFYGDKPGSGWIAWKELITSSSNGRVNFNLDKDPDWIRTFHAPKDGGDFFLEGVKGALDYKNEWWFDKNTKELYVILPNGKAPDNNEIQMRKRSITIDLTNRSFIHIENLAVFGGEIKMSNKSENNKIYKVSSFYGNHTVGIQKGFSANKQSVLLNGSNNVIEQCEIAFGAANGIKVTGTNNKILNSLIHDFNYIGSYDAPINARGGKNTEFKGNTIFRGGRDCVQFFNNSSEFSFNDVSESNLIADDCALLYTVGGPHNGKIHHNWFHDTNSRGKLKKAAGIYLDNDAEAFSVHHNVVWNTEWAGIQINWNGKDINVFNNTFWNNSDEMGAWHKAGTAFSNVKVWNNLGFKGAWEPQSDKQNNITTSSSSFINSSEGNFRLSSGADPIDKGKEISNITDGFIGSAPDVGAYEFGDDNWKPGIDWNSKFGPANKCYNLPGEVCSTNTLNTEDLLTAKNKLVVYPNPVRDYLKFRNIKTLHTIHIYNLLGKTLMTTEINTLNNEITLSSLENGIYIVSIDGKKKLKIIKN